MKFKNLVVLILLVGWTGVILSDEIPKFTPEQWEKLEKGKIILTNELKKTDDGEEHALIGAYLIFNQPITTAWSLMEHPEWQERYLPDLRYSKLIWRKGNQINVEFMVKILFFKLYYRVIHTYYPDKYFFRWSLDPKYNNDLKYLYGEWHLFPLKNGKTLAKYLAVVHASFLIPSFIERKLMKDNVPKNMKAFQKWINSGGKYHK